jgi:hypothetical protein
MTDTAAAKCGCARKPDGTCEACVAAVGELVKTLVDQMAENQRRMQETISGTGAVCQPCNRRQLDLSLGRAIRGLAMDKAAGYIAKRDIVIGVALMLVEAGRRSGISEWPLTEGAILAIGTA